MKPDALSRAETSRSSGSIRNFMWKLFLLSAVCFFTSSLSYSQQLIINEVSQGSGSGEYVEFVVIGNPTCQTPVPCIDLRGVIIDDNNGYFASGGGTGIATGAVRFANVSFWSCVPQGTYIVIYNESDVNPALPPQDSDPNDGNCRLVLPANSPLLEGTSVSPNTSVSTYPAAGWTAGGGTWNQLAMSNTNDSFQIPNLAVNGSPLHSVSWGNNTSGTIIYFSGSATGKVFSFSNTVSNDYNNQANWTAGTVGVNETPGAANNSANDAWIASMNPQCGISNTVQATLQTTPVSCGGTCDGSITATVTGGVGPYTYNWSNGGTTASISNLCAGVYTLTVSDAGGCTFTTQATVQTAANTLQLSFQVSDESCQNLCDGTIAAIVSGGATPYTYSWSNGGSSALINNLCDADYSLTVTDNNGCTISDVATVNAGNTTPDATINPAGPFTTDQPAQQLSAMTAGGSWSAVGCSNCITGNGLFDPQASGAGTFTVCYTISNGSCSDNDCISITVTEGCTPQFTEEVVQFCAEDSVMVFGQWENTPDTYTETYTDINGCDSTHTIVLLVYPIFNNQDVIGLCPGDSVLVYGNWVSEAGTYDEPRVTPQGCNYIFHTIVYNELPEFCQEEPFSFFVPNTFTPNGDAVNDTFEVVLLGGTLDEGYIFNRWGNQIKKFDNENRTWDGTTAKGEPVQEGVYTYVIYYTPTDKTREIVHGFVTVVR